MVIDKDLGGKKRIMWVSQYIKFSFLSEALKRRKRKSKKKRKS